MGRALALAAALLLAACQQAPVSPTPTAVSPASRALAEGDALMARGDYPGAIEKYQQAADLAPDGVRPRFALGTAYSFAEKRPEAIAQFRWVLAHADAASSEYQEAHRWLAHVGALPVSPATAGTTPAAAAFPPDPSSLGRLVGKTAWPGVNPRDRLITGQLSVVGDEPVTHDVKRTRAFRLGDGYEFKNLPAGRYRIVAVIEETTVWDEKVTVEGGKDTTLTLTQSTSPLPVGTFAPPATAAAAPPAPRRP
jgi:tetratricopeptide (TPR) repeat protein